MKRYVMQGQIFDELPIAWENTSPLTERWWLANGGTIEEVEDKEQYEEGIKYDVATIKQIFEVPDGWHYYLDLALKDVGQLDAFNRAAYISTDMPDFRLLVDEVHKRFVHHWQLEHCLYIEGWTRDKATAQAEMIWSNKVDRVKKDAIYYEGI